MRCWMRPLLAIGFVIVLALILAGCQTTTATGAIDGVSTLAKADRGRPAICGAIEPIRWSRSDTAETITQVKEHNAVFDALCRRG